MSYDKITSENYAVAYRQGGFASTKRMFVAKGIPYDLIDDLVQEAWCAGWNKREQYKGEAKIYVWVNTIALNVLRSMVRSLKFKQEQYIQELTEVSKIEYPDAYRKIEYDRMLASCTPKERWLLRRRSEGYSFAEIAEEDARLVSNPVCKVTQRVNLSRLYKKLRKRNRAIAFLENKSKMVFSTNFYEERVVDGKLQTSLSE